MAISDENDARHQAALTAIQEYPGLVLIGDASLAVKSGKPVLLLDKFNASYLCDAGKIDVSAVTDLLCRREITAIGTTWLDTELMGQPWWPRPIRDAIFEHYEEVQGMEGYWVFLPAGPGTPARRSSRTKRNPSDDRSPTATQRSGTS